MPKRYSDQQLKDMLPPGNPDFWDDQQWVEFETMADRLQLSLDQEAMIWEHVVQQMDTVDAEFKEFTENLEIEDVKPASSAVCRCDGPPNGKYLTHVKTCPASPDHDPKWGGGTGGTAWNYKTCKHVHQPLDINGVTVMGSAARDVKEHDYEIVQYGIYASQDWKPDILLTPGFTPVWVQDTALQINSVHLDWPDYKTPLLPIELVKQVLTWGLETAASGSGVEVGCMGGHGRTGTMLGLFGVISGMNPVEACENVWNNYCEHAIESEEQVEYIGEMYGLVIGQADWLAHDKQLRKQYRKMVDLFAPKYSKVTTYGGGAKGKQGQSIVKKAEPFDMGSWW